MNNLTRSRQAFTLIELLVVISIIAVLAGLLLPVVGRVSENARKVETKSSALQIVAAIKNYQTEYGQYPVDADAVGSKDKTYLNASNKDVFAVLRATNNAADSTLSANMKALNSRRIVYFEGRDAKNAKTPKSGFVPTGTNDAKGNPNNPKALAGGDFVDSWGNLFCITMDSSYNDVVPNPYPEGNIVDDASKTGGEVLRFGVVVWTYGNDGKIGDKGTALGTYPNFKYGDDVISWQ